MQSAQDLPASITGKHLQAELSQACERAGSRSAWARKHGIPVSVVSEILCGKRDASEAIANALGYFRVVRFVSARAKDASHHIAA